MARRKRRGTQPSGAGARWRERAGSETNPLPFVVIGGVVLGLVLFYAFTRPPAPDPSHEAFMRELDDVKNRRRNPGGPLRKR